MRVFLTGGSGDLGQVLSGHLELRGDVPVRFDVRAPLSRCGLYVQGSISNLSGKEGREGCGCPFSPFLAFCPGRMVGNRSHCGSEGIRYRSSVGFQMITQSGSSAGLRAFGIGKGPVDVITLADIMGAKRYATVTLGLPWIGSLHGLQGWCDLLIEERNHRHVPYAPALARSLGSQVRRLTLNWSEQLRYRINRPYQGEVNTTIQSVSWLLGQYRFL
jgi:hypothetical protein